MCSQGTAPVFAQSHGGGEANLILPDLSDVVSLTTASTVTTLLLIGIVICMLGLLFGLAIYMNLKKLPVHAQCARSLSSFTKPAKLI